MAVYPLESFAVSVYEKIEPLTADDEANNFALAHYIASLSSVFQDIDDLASEVGGRPPWAALFDIANLPSKGLGWLGQFVGVSLKAGLSDADQRAHILGTAGFWRGTPASLRSAAQAYLTGTKTVTLRERDPAACAAQPAYGLTVITRESETPVADWPATNLEENSGVETDLAGYAPSGIGAGYGRAAVFPHSGDVAIYVPFDAAPSGWISGTTRSGARIPVTAGKLYTLSTYILPEVGTRTVNLGMDWYDAGGAMITNPRQAPQVVTNGIYQRIEYTQTAPAGAVSVVIYPMVWNAGSIGDWYLIDDIQFEQNSRATPLIPTTVGPVSRPTGTGPIGAALRAQKPAGIVLNYQILAGNDYQSLLTNHPLYSDVFADYLTYQGVVNDVPGT